jgi:mono/diheme cytochrome c family protein
MKIIQTAALIATIIIVLSLQSFRLKPIKNKAFWNENSKVSQLLWALGEAKPNHYFEYTPEQVAQGRDLVFEGRTQQFRKGMSRYVSVYYACTYCHNTAQEDPDLRLSNPDTRLPYVQAKGLKLLQGTTFYGIANRESYYNDDYYKKYGDEVRAANHSLENATQLCAIECSQGRKLDDWEVKAILAYYWSIQYTLKDLALTAADYEKINQNYTDKSQHTALIKWIKGFYLQKSPATFADAPYDKSKGYEGLVGNAATGKVIYKISCQTCHKPQGVSDYVLDDDKVTFRQLKSNFAEESPMSLYKISRYGTHAEPGHRPYMPHYTLEKMSNQQLEDLRAYIVLRAK